jgi:phospholipid N-methyltransferase
MNYLKKIISTGAVRKTPQRIIDKISQEVTQRENTSIIEVGAGQGEITKALLNGAGKADYFAFEIDHDFYVKLRTAFPNIHVLKHDAFKFHEVQGIPASVDYFVSSIPLSFYKQSEIETFCNHIKKHVKGGGKIIILFTAFWLIAPLKKALPGSRIEPFATLPPYFLAVYEKVENNL